MTDVKVKNVDRVFKSIDDRLRNAVTDKEFVKGAADKIVDDNKKSLRTGKDPTTLKKLKSLEDVSVRYRKYIAKYNKTGDFYKANRSNLTLSGQLINAIKSVIKRAGRNVTIRLDIDSKRSPYKTKTGKSIKTPNNKQIAKFQKDAGRAVLGISDKTTKQIITQLKQFLRRKLR